MVRSIEEDANQIAKAVSFIERERKLSGADVVQLLIFSWLREPDGSLERRETSLTAPGLCQHFIPQARGLRDEMLACWM
jgi:hypothetical protein